MKKRKSLGMFSVEYVVVLVLFIVISAYFTYRLLEQKPIYVREVQKEIFRSENYMISELLVNDGGEPQNWNLLSSPIRRIGLLDTSKNQTNLVSRAKASALHNLCAGSAGYRNVKANFSASHNFSISVVDTVTGLTLCDCNPSGNNEILASFKRIVAFDNGDYGEVLVKSW
jgi:hypothetical protein